MASKEIEVNTDMLASDTNQLTQQLQTARQFIKTMSEDMVQLDSMWDGPANEAFMAQFNNDAQYAEELCKMVEKLIECMENAKKQYDTCEAEVSSLIASI